jgi:hypothetical protein
MNRFKKNIFYLFWIVLVVTIVGFLGFSFASPMSVSFPKKETSQIRLLLSIDGNQTNFSTPQFQKPISQLCNQDISPYPIGAYNQSSQVLNLHWKDMTGSNILRYYGFNNKGPFKGYMGVNLTNFPNYEAVPILGELLPAPKEDYNYFVYTGNQYSYTQRKRSEFLNKSITDLLDSSNSSKNSIISINTNAQVSKEKNENIDKEIIINQTPPIPVSSEESSQPSSIQTPAQPKPEEDTVLGTIVVFIQKNEPTQEQVMLKFTNLEQAPVNLCNN